MNCNECKEHRTSVTFAAFESMKFTLERTIRRLWIVIIITILLLFASNAAWIYYESQFAEQTHVEQAVDVDNGRAAVSGMGDATCG